MSKYDVIGKTATAHSDDDKHTIVIYHNTKVVVVDKEANTITLNTGGWSTKTTMLRMNQASRYYCLGYSVYQKAFKWYVDYKGTTYNFDGDTITLGGK